MAEGRLDLVSLRNALSHYEDGEDDWEDEDDFDLDDRELALSMAPLLTQAFRDLPSSNLCLEALATLPLLLRSTDYFMDHHRTDPVLGDLLDSAVSLVSNPLSPEQISAIEQSLGTCSCIYGDNEEDLVDTVVAGAHDDLDVYDNPSQIDFALLIQRIVQLLCDSLELLKSNKAPSSAQRWPGPVSRLIPSSPESLVQAIYQWTLLLDKPYPAYYLSLIIRRGHIPTGLVSAIESHQNLRNWFRSSFHSFVDAFIQAPMRNDGTMELEEEFRHFASILVHFPLEKYLGRPAKPLFVDIIRLTSNARPKYARAKSSSSVPLQDRFSHFLPIENAFSMYMDVSMPLCVMIPEAEKTNIIPTLPAWWMKNFAKSVGFSKGFPEDDDVSLYSFLVGSLQKGIVCHNPRCESTAEKLLDIDHTQALSACNGCKAVRYCSKTCQTSGWKVGPPRHKDYCKDLATVFRIYKQIEREIGPGAKNAAYVPQFEKRMEQKKLRALASSLVQYFDRVDEEREAVYHAKQEQAQVE